MAFELRDGQGSLFRNDKAGDNPKAPSHTGTCKIAGVEYRISAWVKDGKRGKFFSLAIQPSDYKPAARPQQEAVQKEADWNDPIPF